MVDRERLLAGNWNIRETAGTYFQQEWFFKVSAAPADCDLVRYWDLAATTEHENPEAAWTAGVLMGRAPDGRYYVVDVVRFRGTPGTVLKSIKDMARADGVRVTVGIEQDPGQAGKAQAQLYAKELAGFRVKINIPRENKGVRAKPYAAQVEAGNVSIVEGKWNKAYLHEAENFDGVNGFMDQVDASSGAFYLLTKKSRIGAWGSKGGRG
jgi:predicted phage terminase large subunit-like protein